MIAGVFAAVLGLLTAVEAEGEVLNYTAEDHSHVQVGEAGNVVSGFYRFATPDGVIHTVNYKADDKGYRAHAFHPPFPFSAMISGPNSKNSQNTPGSLGARPISPTSTSGSQPGRPASNTVSPESSGTLLIPPVNPAQAVTTDGGFSPASPLIPPGSSMASPSSQPTTSKGGFDPTRPLIPPGSSILSPPSEPTPSKGGFDPTRPLILPGSPSPQSPSSIGGFDPTRPLTPPGSSILSPPSLPTPLIGGSDPTRPLIPLIWRPYGPPLPPGSSIVRPTSLSKGGFDPTKPFLSQLPPATNQLPPPRPQSVSMGFLPYFPLPETYQQAAAFCYNFCTHRGCSVG